MDHLIKLKDGRNLNYAEYGDPNGKPLFFFHGWPSSRLHGKRIDESATKLNIHVISIDRPGFGFSDYKSDRTLLDFSNDIIELADQLNINKFSVMGVSGGGPYSAVCAYKIPERIINAGIVVGLAPPYIKNICDGMAWVNKISWTNYHRFPILRFLAALSIWIQAKVFQNDLSAPFLAKADKNLNNDYFKIAMLNDRNESIRQGIKAAEQELKIYSNEWGFNVKDIKSKVYLYYGEDDKNVSLAMGKYYASEIPNSELTIYPKGGHFSWIEHSDEILRTLID